MLRVQLARVRARAGGQRRPPAANRPRRRARRARRRARRVVWRRVGRLGGRLPFRHLRQRGQRRALARAAAKPAARAGAPPVLDARGRLPRRWGGAGVAEARCARTPRSSLAFTSQPTTRAATEAEQELRGAAQSYRPVLPRCARPTGWQFSAVAKLQRWPAHAPPPPRLPRMCPSVPMPRRCPRSAASGGIWWMWLLLLFLLAGGGYLAATSGYLDYCRPAPQDGGSAHKREGGGAHGGSARLGSGGGRRTCAGGGASSAAGSGAVDLEAAAASAAAPTTAVKEAEPQLAAPSDAVAGVGVPPSPSPAPRISGEQPPAGDAAVAGRASASPAVVPARPGSDAAAAAQPMM